MSCNDPVFDVVLGSKYKEVTCPVCKNTWKEYDTGRVFIVTKECGYCLAKYRVIPERRAGFIYNTKSFMNYNNLSTKRKMRFWILLPLVYFNKLLIAWRYK